MKKGKEKRKGIKFAVKINLYLAVLIASYYLLEIAILQGKLFVIESFLHFLFYINCFIVGLKVFKARKERNR